MKCKRCGKPLTKTTNTWYQELTKILEEHGMTMQEHDDEILRVNGYLKGKRNADKKYRNNQKDNRTNEATNTI